MSSIHAHIQGIGRILELQQRTVLPSCSTQCLSPAVRRIPGWVSSPFPALWYRTSVVCLVQPYSPQRLGSRSAKHRPTGCHSLFHPIRLMLAGPPQTLSEPGRFNAPSFHFPILPSPTSKRMRARRRRRVSASGATSSFAAEIHLPAARTATAPATASTESARNQQVCTTPLAGHSAMWWQGSIGRAATCSTREASFEETSITHPASAPICHQPYDTATRGAPRIVFPGCPAALFHRILAEP